VDVIRTKRRGVPTGLVLAALAGILLACAAWYIRPQPSSRHMAVIARSELTTASVRRGPFSIVEECPGVLLPDRTHVVSAANEGIVSEIRVHVGAVVGPTSVIAVLENPKIAADARDRAADVKALQEELDGAKVEANAARLQAEASLETAVANASEADTLLSSYVPLHSNGYLSDQILRAAQIKAVEGRNLLRIAREQQAVELSRGRMRIASASARLARGVYAYQVARRAVERLTVRAGQAGTVQDVAVDPGEHASPETILAHIVRDRDLKAVLQVPEADARGVRAGLAVRLRTSGGPFLDGIVSRIDPSVKNGTVSAEVALSSVPEGVHPQQTVDGTIQIAHVRDTLSVARPYGVTDYSRKLLYRLARDGMTAEPVPVVLGAGSVDVVQIVSGLSAGDTIITSDSSAFDGDRVSIK
jgi:HlyD family secretion protein